MIKQTIISLLILITFNSNVFAASVNERQANQKERIKQGVISGELTTRETKRMAKQQKRIARKERAYRSDGVLTPVERADLQTDLSVTSAKIYRQKHDQQSR